MQFRYQNPEQGIDTIVELPEANTKVIQDFIQQQRDLILCYKAWNGEKGWTAETLAEAGMAIASRQPDADIWQGVTDNHVKAALYLFRQQAIAKV